VLNICIKRLMLWWGGLVMEVDLLPLKLYDLDLILGIDWPGRYKA
jgi:hypothetical protein